MDADNTDASVVVHPLSVFLQSVILGNSHNIANFCHCEGYLSDIITVRRVKLMVIRLQIESGCYSTFYFAYKVANYIQISNHTEAI